MSIDSTRRKEVGIDSKLIGGISWIGISDPTLDKISILNVVVARFIDCWNELSGFEYFSDFVRLVAKMPLVGV